MNLAEAKNELLVSAEAGISTLLVGPSGNGKSEMSLQVFGQLRNDGLKMGLNWGLGIVFLATQTPPDIIGYQYKGERDFGDGIKVTVTDPSCPLWMQSVPFGIPGTAEYDPGGKPAWMYDRFYLIIEEYGQGEGDVKKSVAEVFLNLGTPPWVLPENSIVTACSNEGTRYGVTKDYDFCITRRRRLDITGDAGVTIAYWQKPYRHRGRIWNVMGLTKAWAQKNPGILFEKEPVVQGPWANPRSICAADRYLQVKAARNNGKVPTDPVTQEGVAGIIGMPATNSLMGHVQFLVELPSYDEVVADPSNCPVPTKADLLLLMAYELAGWAKEDDLPAVLTYIQRMPKDMAVAFMTALLQRDYERLITNPAVQAWVNRNAALVSIISSLG